MSWAEPNLEQYYICKERDGHTPSGFRLTSNPPWDTCKHCGTAFRYETITHELQVPEGYVEPERNSGYLPIVADPDSMTKKSYVDDGVTTDKIAGNEDG